MNETAPLPTGMPDAPAGDFDFFGWPWTGLVTLLTLLVYLVITYNVGRARTKFDTPAPRMDGPEGFLRALRVQGNMLEQMVVFLPLLWIAALSSHDGLAAGLGALWPLARIWYTLAYLKDPAKRHVPFILGLAVTAVLFALSAVQLVRSLFVL